MAEPTQGAGHLTDVVVVDRASPVPLYYQVAQAMQEAIEGGLLPPGMRLENEIQLADDLGLSRPTMRRAMEYLVEQGLIIRRRGVGTTIVQPRVRRPRQLTSLYDELEAAGLGPTTEVLALGIAPVPAEAAEALGVAAATPVHTVVRIRSSQGRPVARLLNYLPTTVPGIGVAGFTRDALESTGLYRLMRAAGVHLHAADETIGARRATTDEARLLDEVRGAALLTLDRTTYDDAGRVVEYGSHLYAASRYRLSLGVLAT
jgi:DNA-binding GntR family transcriptional regulator